MMILDEGMTPFAQSMGTGEMLAPDFGYSY